MRRNVKRIATLKNITRYEEMKNMAQINIQWSSKYTSFQVVELTRGTSVVKSIAPLKKIYGKSIKVSLFMFGQQQCDCSSLPITFKIYLSLPNNEIFVPWTLKRSSTLLLPTFSCSMAPLSIHHGEPFSFSVILSTQVKLKSKETVKSLISALDSYHFVTEIEVKDLNRGERFKSGMLDYMLNLQIFQEQLKFLTHLKKKFQNNEGFTFIIITFINVFEQSCKMEKRNSIPRRKRSHDFIISSSELGCCPIGEYYGSDGIIFKRKGGNKKVSSRPSGPPMSKSNSRSSYQTLAFNNYEFNQKLKMIKVPIIDEISMVSENLLTYISQIFQVLEIPIWKPFFYIFTRTSYFKVQDDENIQRWTKQKINIPQRKTYCIIYSQWCKANQRQYPIINVYTLTVHKVQRITLPNVSLNLDTLMFKKGQAYTALIKEYERLEAIASNPLPLLKSLQNNS
ncbi:hypothetical protein Glove_184g28 [Diversispora epigaea]|uniref:Uncharacterized protein n=1 Tax=Diversispora epigaea TaxID=1348612 RepID=A0A397IQC5_9GLOM|nr:hypothetical protein Glove_184g28 [Diversispora epigaea]